MLIKLFAQSEQTSFAGLNERGIRHGPDDESLTVSDGPTWHKVLTKLMANDERADHREPRKVAACD
jgi:hypothetical protein